MPITVQSNLIESNILKNNLRSVRFLATLITFAFSTTVFAELVVEDGYVRKPIPGRSMSAAFMTIKNVGSDDILLKTATIEGAKSVEIHTHSHVDGVMRMRQVHGLMIKAGSSVVLAPGGLHLMIFGITKLPENPKLALCDEGGRCSDFSIAVRKLVQ